MKWSLLLMAGIVASSSAANAQVLEEKDISANLALEIAQTAMAQCQPHVSVAVVDRAGRLRAFLQGDGASPHNIELARRKAFTALTFKMPSADWKKELIQRPDLAGQRSLTDVIPLGGGMPIMVGDEAIGGIGLSGAPNGQEQEESCAKAGIAKVADQLK